MDKFKMLTFAKSKAEMGFISEFYLAPEANPEFYPFTIGALALCAGDMSKFGDKLINLIEKSIEHDVLMNASMPKKPSMLKRIFRR
jgi:hypothetical protein